MTLRLVSPAPIVETRELAGDGLKAWPQKAVAYQLLVSDSYGFRDATGRLVAAFGLCQLEPERDGEELAELWFLCRREVAGHLVSLAHLARLITARATQDGPVRIRAVVRAGHRPGARMARIVGMRLVETVAGFEIWELSGEQNRQGALRWGRQGRPPSPDSARDGGGGSAPGAGGPAKPDASATGPAAGRDR